MTRTVAWMAAVITSIGGAARGFPAPGDDGREPAGTRNQRVTTPSAESSFNPMPEMWGLRELEADTPLGDLDASLALYVRERARFRIEAARGTIHLAGGRQVLAGTEGSEVVAGEELRSSTCLCALEYESLGSAETLHVAAGVYRVAAAPVVTEPEAGVWRVELVFEPADQTGRSRLGRLVCWTRGDDTVMPIVLALPEFARLTRKRHAGFVDPPMDDRLVFDSEVVRRQREEPGGRVGSGGRDVVIWNTELDPARAVRLSPQRINTEFVPGGARPGLVSVFRELGTGRPLTIDYSGYYRDDDLGMLSLDRAQGIYFRDPTFWP